MADDPQFGISLPKTVAGALEINKTTDTDLWKKAVKELANAKVAWKTSGSSKAQHRSTLEDATHRSGLESTGSDAILSPIGRCYSDEGSSNNGTTRLSTKARSILQERFDSSLEAPSLMRYSSFLSRGSIRHSRL